LRFAVPLKARALWDEVLNVPLVTTKKSVISLCSFEQRVKNIPFLVPNHEFEHLFYLIDILNNRYL
jgi:hypothetical protein